MNFNGPRLFMYSSGVLMLGSFFYVGTYSLLPYVELPGWIGWAVLFGFGFAVANVTLMIGKRYTRKSDGNPIIAFLLGLFFVLPSFVQILISKMRVLEDTAPLFFGILIIASLLGTYLGMKKGIAQRELMASIPVENS